LHLRHLVVVGGHEGALLALEPPDLVPQKLDAGRAAFLDLAAAYQSVNGYVEHAR
jgi:hypothetical protein